jgi:uncharacterized coiled-coil protein SlyX
MNRSPLRAFLLIPLVLACFALSPAIRAVDPPPDGGYPGQNTAEGEDALFSLTTGTDNSALGFDALFGTTTGSGNTAVGSKALARNIEANDNTAVGSLALSMNSKGGKNTAVGGGALFSNIRGYHNTAVGFKALSLNTSGSDNTAIGYSALLNNVGSFNTAVGSLTLVDNTGISNTALGMFALESNTSGIVNTATGKAALQQNTTGSYNTATGWGTLSNNSTGHDNTAIGNLALTFNTTGNNNTAIGSLAFRNNTTGENNVAVGFEAGENLTTGDNNINIAAPGVADESNTIRIGVTATHQATYVAGISGATVPDGVTVVVGADGHLGTTTSSARYKEAIKPMNNASEVILALKPVTFRYKKELDPKGISQFGLVAEDVAKVEPALVARDDQGKVYTVRYEAVNAMLLNEFLKEHRKVEEQEATIAQLKFALAKQEAVDAEQQKQIEALTGGLQKVSAQIEVTKPAPQVVNNNQ